MRKSHPFLHKVVRQLGKPRRNCSVYLPLQKSDERRFLQVGGRISQCLAAEHRQLGCEAARSAMFVRNGDEHVWLVCKTVMVESAFSNHL